MGCRIEGLRFKGALELITEALRMEVKSFGVHISNVAPGDFATNIAEDVITRQLYRDRQKSLTVIR
jgi:NAD(P)-dependent dehydrogenase (short-subunit alcohol dehydrogenase family)